VTVTVEPSRDGLVETWWLDRPEKRNAVTLAMWNNLIEQADRVARDQRVRVVVIRGRGNNFSAGADIDGLGRSLAGDDGTTNYRATNAAAERAVCGLPVPVVAAIDGFCIGGGVQLALACDIRLATHTTRIAVTPAKLGIVYPAVAVRRLVAIVGPAVASELLLTADQLDAAAALRVGLVSSVVDDLDAALIELVTTLLDRSPLTHAATKAVINALINDTDVSEIGRRVEQASLNHPDLDEGIRAFVEKRLPQFSSRPEHL
jgi:enoyl-CoA hydratase/carnithine racemase